MLATQRSETEAAINHSNRLFFAYIVALVASGVLTIFVWRAGNQVQIAIKGDADARIEGAKADAAKANKQAAQANERANSLEHANLVLRGDLNSQYREVAAVQIEAANARKAQQSVQIEVAKQQARTAELASRDRIIKGFKVTLSVTWPGWREESSQPYLVKSPHDLHTDVSPGDPWQKLICGERRIELRPTHRHVKSQGSPRTRDAFNVVQLTLEPIETSSIVNHDISSLSGCTMLLVTVLTLQTLGPITELSHIRASVEVNGISFPCNDAVVNLPHAGLRDKDFVTCTWQTDLTPDLVQSGV